MANFTKNSLHSIMAHYNASILNCIFKSSSIYCSATADLHIRNCDFKDAKINSGNLTVNNSNFIGIKHGDALIYSEHAKIINSTFINNTASNTAILVLEDYELKDCVFINNRDATILSGDSLLNDSLMPTYLKAKSMNHLRKTYYKSGKSLINAFTTSIGEGSMYPGTSSNAHASCHITSNTAMTITGIKLYLFFLLILFLMPQIS